jgi:SAM-dependent methyltransferase
MTIAKPEAPAATYEKLYAEGDETYNNPEASPYYPLFLAAVDALDACGARNVLEVGCGSGTLGQMVISKSIDYRGFDYAHTGVEKALRKNPKAKFAWGDATTDAPYAGPYDTILCCEVLEHIGQDLEVIGRWRSGSNVVCSVPNFDYHTHVRFFRSEDEVSERYGHLIAIESIRRLSKPQWSGVTWREYLRRARWAREHGWRRVLGTLGVNTFDWAGGWFLFTGTRR